MRLVLHDLGEVALEIGSEGLCHHVAQRRHDQAAERGRGLAGVLQGGEVHHQDAPVKDDIAHVDVADLAFEDVAEARPPTG